MTGPASEGPRVDLSAGYLRVDLSAGHVDWDDWDRLRSAAWRDAPPDAWLQ